MPKILIVDDDKSICELLRDIFKKEGYTIEEAISGNEAFLMFKSTNPDLVLLDVSMPGMNGIELLKKIREINRKVFVVVISAHEDAVLIKEAFELGAYDYIRKPFNVDYLRKSVLSKIVA